MFQQAILLSVKVKKLAPEARLPEYGSPEAAGADLHACLPAPVSIAPGETAFIPTGLAVEIPRGYAGFVYARSGLSCKRGLAPANKVGVIDSDYRGEVLVCLHNHGGEAQTVEDGDRVAQLVVAPVAQANFVEAEALADTVRGAGGLGSTGR